MKCKVIAAVLYAAAAIATANWIDYGLAPQQPYGYQVLAKVALVGSGAFVVACAFSLIRYRYSLLLGLAAACLSWTYFGPLAFSLPWRDFLWLVWFHYHGDSQVAAVFVLLVATIYSLVALRPAASSFVKTLYAFTA